MQAVLLKQTSSLNKVAGVDTLIDKSRASPRLAVREFFFSLLSEADRQRTDIGWSTASRRVNGFVRFVSTLADRISGVSAKEGDKLVAVASKNNIADVNARIAAHADINHADASGMTAIMYAAQKGNLAMLRALVAAGSAVNMHNKEGKTALFLATEKADIEVIKFLIEVGADAEKVDERGCSPLMYAARHGNSEVADFFLSINVKAATLNKQGWNALMMAAYHGHQEMATAIINAQNKKDAASLLEISLSAASRLARFPVATGIVHAAKNSHFPLSGRVAVNWAVKNGLPFIAIEAFAAAGLRLYIKEFKYIVGKYDLKRTFRDKLRNHMVCIQPTAFRCHITSLYAQNLHFWVDRSVNAPAPDEAGGNPLGLNEDGISQPFTLNHSVDSAGQYRHAMGKLVDIPPEPHMGNHVAKMLDAGWRSQITQLVSEAKESAEMAAVRVASVLASKKSGFVLIDADGKIVAPDSIQFKESLFAFALRRNEYLNQITAPSQKAPSSKHKIEATKAAKKAETEAERGAEQQRLAIQAQAKAILASNETYQPLKLHMPSSVMGLVSRTQAIEAEVRNGTRTDLSDASAEVKALFLKTEQFFDEVMEGEQDLVQHWFLDELTNLLDEISRSSKRIESLMDHQ